MIHIGEKPYQCSNCDKAFPKKLVNSSTIYQPTLQRSHTNAGISKKAFSESSHLKNHIMTHTHEKPYQCSYCKKSFIEKCNLVHHTKNHTREKPYQCSYCEKSFTEKCNLVYHTMTHTRKKPYQCNDCQKCFTEKT